MAAMQKIERVLAVVSGETPDRPPISFWHHFSAAERSGRAAVEAHLKHVQKYDLDFLKVMFDLGYPREVPIKSPKDLKSLQPLQGDEGVFGEQLQTIRLLSRELQGKLLVVSTVFNSWATLRRMLWHEPYRAGVGASQLEDPKTQRIIEFVKQDRSAVAGALEVIGRSLGHFSQRLLEAGCDGIFLSVRDDWLENMGPRAYDELVRRSDRKILAAVAAGRCNILHVCGQAVDFAAFATYPVHMINWADRTEGPTIAEVASTVKAAPCAGVNHLRTLAGGSPQTCADEVQDALRQAGGRPMAVSPGCTYNPERVPPANLFRLRQVVNTPSH